MIIKQFDFYQKQQKSTIIFIIFQLYYQIMFVRLFYINLYQQIINIISTTNQNLKYL